MSLHWSKYKIKEMPSAPFTPDFPGWIYSGPFTPKTLIPHCIVLYPLPGQSEINPPIGWPEITSKVPTRSKELTQISCLFFPGVDLYDLDDLET